MKIFLIIASLFFALNSSAYAARQCCAKHGGVAKCDGTAKHICKDGAIGNCSKHNH